MICKKIRQAIFEARFMSLQTGVSYIHKFQDHFQVSIAQGSGKFVIAEYLYGKRTKNFKAEIL